MMAVSSGICKREIQGTDMEVNSSLSQFVPLVESNELAVQCDQKVVYET